MEQWNTKWKINQGPNEMLGSGGAPAKLELFRGETGGNVFVAKSQPGRLITAWEGVQLTQHGSEPLPWEGEKLDPFDATQPTIVKEYEDRIEDHVAKINPETDHLEGKLNPSGASKPVSMYLAKKAIQTSESQLDDLLIVLFTKSPVEATPGFVSPIEDGTGHGNKT